MKKVFSGLMIALGALVVLPQISAAMELEPEAMEDTSLAAENDPNSPSFKPESLQPATVETPKKETRAAPSQSHQAPEAYDIPLIEPQNAMSSKPGVTFVTGGVGADEREAIESAKADYNVYITSASNDGAFMGDVRVVIQRKQGTAYEEMLSVVAGPLLYVRLPAGSYMVDATLGKQTKRHSFSLAKKATPVRVHLGWK